MTCCMHNKMFLQEKFCKIKHPANINPKENLVNLATYLTIHLFKGYYIYAAAGQALKSLLLLLDYRDKLTVCCCWTGSLASLLDII